MKIDWDYLHTRTTSTSIPGSMTTNTKTNNDIYDAITYASNRIMAERETKMFGTSFDEVRDFFIHYGLFIDGITRDSLGDCRIEGRFDAQRFRHGKIFDKCTEASHSKKPVTAPKPKKVIFSGPATTILWTDGTKTTVKCQRHDIYDKDTGIAMCYLKKMLGNKGNYNNIFREAMKVAVAQESKEKIASTIDSSMHTSSTLDDMSNNLDKINKCVKDITDTLSGVVVKDAAEALIEFVKENK